jgi:hypothetical protein
MSGLAVTVTDDGNYSQDDIYNAMRAADKAGDTQAVKALIAHLQGGGAPAGVQQPASPVAPPAPPMQNEGGFGTAIRNLANGATAGVADQISAGVNAVIPMDALTGHDVQSVWGGHSLSDAYTHNLQQERAVGQSDAAAHPIIAPISQVAGAIMSPLNKIAAPIEGASFVANAGRALASGATYGGISGASGSTADTAGGVLHDAATGSLIGGAGGAAAISLAGVGGAVLRGADNVGAKALNAAGIEMTPGQVLGNGWKAAEDKLTSVPLLGDAIKQARARGVESFNTERINSALAPIGDKLPEGTTGADAIAYGQNAIDNQYSQARAGMSFAKDDKYNTDLAALRDRIQNGGADSLAPAYRRQFDDVVKNTIDRRLDDTGSMAGDAYKDSVAAISKKGAAMSAGNNPTDAREYGSALKELSGIMDAAARRNPATAPESSAMMDAADKAYPSWVRIQDAAQRPGGELGTFSPGQYDAAVKKGDTTIRHNAYSQGNAFGQPMSTDAINVLGREAPNSFTADRLMMARLATGAALGIGGHEAGLSPGEAVGLGLTGAVGAGVYSKGGNALATKMLLNRGPISGAIGQQVSRFAPAIGGAGNALALQYSANR